MKKLLLLFLTFCLMLAVLSGCSQRLPTLTVTFFDVGKGDCILLECDGHAAMIDAGFDNTANDILSALADKGIDTLDFLLLTHMDKDHVGGADKFLENLTIGAVYAPDYEKDAKQYQQYVDALAASGMTAIHPAEPLTLSFAQAQITLLPPQQVSYEQSNDYSILAELVYGQTRFLFAGDAEGVRLQEYLSGTPHTADVLKVPHHGRWDALSDDFFKAVMPRYAVITCDSDNMPDQQVLDALKALGTEVHGTVYGDVIFISDGATVQPAS